MSADANLPTQYPAISDPTTDPAAMLQTIRQLKEAVELLCGTRKPNLGGLNQAVFEMRSRTGSLSATIREVNEVQTTATTALAQRTLTLEASLEGVGDGLDDVTARVTAVETAYVDADEALARRATDLEAEFAPGGTVAQVRDVAQAAASAAGAVATRTNALEAKFNPGGEIPQLAQNLASVSDTASAAADAAGAAATAAINAQARADSASAFGGISLTANAGVGGTTASYSWNIVAGNKQTGMFATVDAAGEGNTTFITDRFRLFDPARGPVPIFNYSAGLFSFNTNVEINGNLMVNGSIQTNGIALGAITGSSGDYQTVQDAGVGFTVKRSNSTIFMIAAYDGAPTRYPFGSASSGVIKLYIDSVIVGEVQVATTVEGNSDNRAIAIMSTPCMRALTLEQHGFGAGYHSFYARLEGGTRVGGISLFVLELAR